MGGPFEMTFDFHDHVLRIVAADKEAREVELRPRTVAEFHQVVMAALRELSIEVSIDERPCEIADAVRFSEDTIHASYDGEFARRFWRVLAETDRVMKRFRTAFLGKCSPVHFFWGSFDLAVTRFSGRRAPLHPGGVPGLADWVVQEAYSHEVSSAGFWPGGDGMEKAVFYSYAYPEPDGFGTAQVMPTGAYYDVTFHEFVLPYEIVRLAPDPDATLSAFLQSTYEAAANASGWDRASLECAIGRPRIARPV
jgi:hypothetical protein